MEKILIDGYNLLYKDGALKNLAERSLEEAREELVAAIASYRSGDTEIVVVFDGRGAESRRRLKLSSGIQVRFSRFPQTADEVIVDMIEKERRRVSLTVVTSDKKDIGRVARAEGVRWISSEAFIRRLQRSRRSGGAQEKPVNTPSSEVEYWLERFGPEGRDKED